MIQLTFKLLPFSHVSRRKRLKVLVYILMVIWTTDFQNANEYGYAELH